MPAPIHNIEIVDDPSCLHCVMWKAIAEHPKTRDPYAVLAALSTMMVNVAEGNSPSHDPVFLGDAADALSTALRQRRLAQGEPEQETPAPRTAAFTEDDLRVRVIEVFCNHPIPEGALVTRVLERIRADAPHILYQVERLIEIVRTHDAARTPAGEGRPN